MCGALHCYELIQRLVYGYGPFDLSTSTLTINGKQVIDYRSSRLGRPRPKVVRRDHSTVDVWNPHHLLFGTNFHFLEKPHKILCYCTLHMSSARLLGIPLLHNEREGIRTIISSIVPFPDIDDLRLE
jgi:hypothetical protein